MLNCTNYKECDRKFELPVFSLLAYLHKIHQLYIFTYLIQVNWHPVFWGLALQFIFALLILRTRAGFEAFNWCGDRVTEFLTYSDEGAAFVFGPGFAEHFFAFKVCSCIGYLMYFCLCILYLFYLTYILLKQAVFRYCPL